MATSTQINSLTALYVGYFNRAPDPAGLQFWIDELDGGRDYNTIAADFAASPEATALYPYLTSPDVSSPAVFITSIYQNLFNRAPDAAGLEFWSVVLADNAVSVADMIEAIINGAVDDAAATPPSFDGTTINNKIEAGFDWAVSAGDTPGYTYDAAAAAAAKAAISGVTNDPATVDAAKAATDAFFLPGEVFALTTGTDNIVGTDGNDTIRGFSDDDDATNIIDTLNPGDIIDGGAGIDTLEITLLNDNDAFGDGFGAGATVTNVEILKVIDLEDDGVDFDLSGFSGLQQIVLDVKGSNDTYDFYNLQDELVSVTLDGTRAGDKSFEFHLHDISNSLYTGDNDELTINVINAGSESDESDADFSATNVNGDDVFEAYSIVVDGDDNYLYIDNDDDAADAKVTTLTAVNAAGNSGSLKLDLDEQDSLETVDASAMTGDFRFEFDSSTDAGQEIAVTSGSGDDHIELHDGSFTVDTGTGADRVELYNGKDADIGDDVLDGGEGTDTIAGDVNIFGNSAFADSTISNFEIIELFGSANSDLTVDVADYEIVIISDDLTDIDEVTIEGTNGKTVVFEENTQSDNTIKATSTGSSDELTLSFEEETSGTIDFADITDIETVNILTSSEADDLTFGSVNISGVETLVFSGEGDIDIDGGSDDGSLTTLDLSAMTGQFDNNDVDLNDSGLDNVIIGNLGNNSYIDIQENGSNTFSFTGTLDNFVSIEGFEAGFGEDILDLSSFGIANLTQLTLTDTGANVTVTSDAFDGTINLVGIADVGDLDLANFTFA